MKRLNYCLLGLGILLAVVGCTKTQTQLKNEIPVVDVTKSYPKKDIILQDIADVDYIPLETRDDVLIDNNYRLCTISPDSILVGNYKEGSIFLFNGQGKVLQKFNRKGQSGSEYQAIWGVFFDKKSQEIIIWDYPYQHRFQAYDVAGNYQRTLPIDKKYSFVGNEIVNFDDNALLCHDRENLFFNKSDSAKQNLTPFVLISKKEGKKLGTLPISLSKRCNSNIKIKQERGDIIIWADLHSITNNGTNFILSEISKDTIFLCSKEQELKPLLVRTPNIQEMQEPLSFLQVEKTTSGYIFGKIIGKETEKKHYFSNKKICVDRNNNEVYEYKIVNSDVPKVSLGVEWFLDNDSSMLLGADKIIELLEERKLKGKLKEIAENLKEDDNPVWMRVKFKN